MTKRELLRNGAQLAGLWGVAVSQPLFEVTKAGEAFILAGWRGGDVVLFALGVAFLPAALMLGAEAVATRIRAPLGATLHTVFVGAVAGIFVAYTVKQQTAWSSKVAVAIILAAGAGAAYAFHRLEPVRAFLTLLSPASVLFVVLFLFVSPVKHLVLPSGGSDLSGPRPSAPVVLIVFDEFPTLSLLDGRGELDRRSYPTFARLARDGTWFRNATSVADFTKAAVPAVLTGRTLDGSEPGSASAHPNNLLALFARRGGVVAREEVTRMCPREACPQNRPDALPGRFTQLLPALGKLSLALFLPDAVYEHLPATHPSLGEPALVDDGLRRIAASAGAPGVLHYVHAFLPHQPWTHLPSGKIYGPVRANRQDLLPDVARVPLKTGLPSFPSVRWTRDANQVVHALQLHLAQVRFTDRVLGEVLDRLRASGAYDRALILVTADHGIAFQAGRDARRVARSTAPAILSVPFFLKLPRQRRGGISERFVRTVDVAPTIAAALGTRLPWRTDGRSALGTAAPAARRVTVHAIESHRTLEVDPAELARLVRVAARRQAALFYGSDPDRIFRPGRYGSFVGRAARDFEGAPPAALRYALEGGPRALDFHPRSGFVPALIAGFVEGHGAAGRSLAIALNGKIAATTALHRSGAGQRFETLVAKRYLRPGRNRIALYAIAPGPAGTRLARIRAVAP